MIFLKYFHSDNTSIVSIVKIDWYHNRATPI